MPQFPPKSEYQGCPWHKIREQYETTDISLRMLATQHGIKSKTVIERRIKNEAWTRNPGRIASHLALVEVAAFEQAASDLPEPSQEAEKVDAQTLREEADAATILTARGIATMQTKRISHQLALARDIQNAGMSIIKRLVGVLEADDRDVGEHIKRLIAISPEGEKMASLLKAASEAVDRAVAMERRALGMDAVHGTVPNADAPPERASSSEAAIAIVKKLDVTLGLRLREFTLATLEARRDRRFGG
jgi:hypothetical protein